MYDNKQFTNYKYNNKTYLIEIPKSNSGIRAKFQRSVNDNCESFINDLYSKKEKKKGNNYLGIEEDGGLLPTNHEENIHDF